MNIAKRLKIKFFFKDDTEVDEQVFMPIFHKWIQEQKLDNHLLLDVADYSHVPNGLSVLLVAHEADYAFDTEHHQLGFSYVRKQDWPESAETLSDRIELCIKENLAAAELLKEAGLPELDFHAIELRLVDKLARPETSEEEAQVQEAFNAALENIFGTAIKSSFEKAPGDSRRSYGLEAKVSVLEPIVA